MRKHSAHGIITIKDTPNNEGDQTTLQRFFNFFLMKCLVTPCPEIRDEL